MMASVWMHRVEACDILVDFNSISGAYDFATKAFSNGNHDYDITMTLAEVLDKPFKWNCVAQTDCVQLIIIPYGCTPDPSWSQRGFVNVTEHHALALGDHDEPEGFIPYESERVWTKETRTVAELNEEIDNYMADWRDITRSAELSMRVLTLE